MTAAQKLRLSALTALVLSAPVHAGVFLTENLAGTMDSACTLDGVPLANGTAFSFQGTFDAVRPPTFLATGLSSESIRWSPIRLRWLGMALMPMPLERRATLFSSTFPGFLRTLALLTPP